MDDLNAITLLYLLKTWDGSGNLLDFADKFRQTKDSLNSALKNRNSEAMQKQIEDGSFSF